jgi:tRNA-dihydrouridine synthase B
MNREGESGIHAVQIAGSDPQLMAQAAQYNVQNGAQIIDINMGCPAKKVNKKAAGSALLQHPELVENILTTVVNSVDVPVTLKIRTGWEPSHRNGVQIAKIAESAGIQCLAVHGRTRACLFKPSVEYDTIKQIKQQISIPVIANGDIDSPEKAVQVLNETQADGVMIGRGAQGQPWIFAQINHYLATGQLLAAPEVSEIAQIMQEHVTLIHQFYGPVMGPQIARKHVNWYAAKFDTDKQFRRRFNAIEDPLDQLKAIETYFHSVSESSAMSMSPAA